jgi:alkylhydroperoxidase/carboxymuconolactone decarboxylase family protein YurZ
MSTADETTEALEARLAEVRAKRGYLLAHHGLMALAFPKLLAGYDAAYTALALDDRVLSHHDREFVWLAVLAATDERVATHHIAKFRAAGGTDAGLGAAFAAAALAMGAAAFDFAARDWARQLAPFDPRGASRPTPRSGWCIWRGLPCRSAAHAGAPSAGTWKRPMPMACRKTRWRKRSASRCFRAPCPISWRPAPNGAA